ncbi:MAG: hypothetical protein PUP91_20800 [Rhizonema sp. PD37]|nr:hypothetical protein [Rhizonema sp. PD37]
MELEQVSQIVQQRLEQHQTGGSTITVKVKFSDYQLLTRSKTSFTPISELNEIIVIIRTMFEGIELGERSVRLLGISLSNLDNVKEAELIQLSLFE